MLFSRQPYHEVDIPLFFREDGLPYVMASWSGRQIACQVDTGTGTIMWPQWLHLDTQQLHISRTQQWPNGVTTRSEWMFTPRIAAGGLVLTNIPTEAIGFPEPTPTDPATLTSPILGMQAFNAFITTFDYRSKKLILRDTNYDVTRQPRSAHSLLISYPRDSDGRVVLLGTLAGHKARFLLDTGCFGIGVTSSFAQKYLSFVPNPATFGTGPPPALHNLSGTLDGHPFHEPNVYVMKRPNGPDVALSFHFFSRYRVTIDQFRNLLLLEKNR
jgi:predicted aspartyl protease